MKLKKEIKLGLVWNILQWETGWRAGSHCDSF